MEKYKTSLQWINTKEDLQKWICDWNDPSLKKRKLNGSVSSCLYEEHCICKYLFGQENGFVCISFDSSFADYNGNNNIQDGVAVFHNQEKKCTTKNGRKAMCIVDQMYYTISMWWNMKRNGWFPTDHFIFQIFACEININANNNPECINKFCFFPTGEWYDGIVFCFPFITPEFIKIHNSAIRKHIFLNI